MKNLNFTEEEVYDLLYEAIVVSPVSGIEEILKAATIVQKFKDKGEVKEEKNDVKLYTLKSFPSLIELEDSEFKFVKNIFEKTNWATSLKIDSLAKAAKFLKAVEAS
jgi:hypothetical protein